MPISEIPCRKSRSERLERVTPFEIQRIFNMLTDEHYPTCGVYRRFEEGRLSDEQLLEAVSYKLTGSFMSGFFRLWSLSIPLTARHCEARVDAPAEYLWAKGTIPGTTPSTWSS